MLLSQAFDKPDNYFEDYLSNPPAERPGGPVRELVSEPRAIKVPPPRSRWELVALHIDEIVVNRLNEMVVSRLDRVENQVRVLGDVMRNTGYEIETYNEHPGDSE